MYTAEEVAHIGPEEANRRSRVAIANLLDQLYQFWPNAVEAWIESHQGHVHDFQPSNGRESWCPRCGTTA